MHPLNVVAVVAEKVVDSWKKKIVVCLTKSNQMHPLNVVVAVTEKDVDSLEEKKIVVCA